MEMQGNLLDSFRIRVLVADNPRKDATHTGFRAFKLFTADPPLSLLVEALGSKSTSLLYVSKC